MAHEDDAPVRGVPDAPTTAGDVPDVELQLGSDAEHGRGGVAGARHEANSR